MHLISALGGEVVQRRLTDGIGEFRIVYGSGHVPLTAMMRFGVVLDLAGFVVIVALVTWLVPVVFR